MSVNRQWQVTPLGSATGHSMMPSAPRQVRRTVLTTVLADRPEPADGASITPMRTGGRRGGQPAYVEWIANDDPTAQARTAELVAGCAGELLSVQPTPYPELSGPLLARGVQSRSIVPDSVRTDERGAAALSREIEAGAQIRTLADLPAHVRIFDRSHAVVSVGPAGAGSELIVDRDDVVQFYAELFARLWAQARPLEADRAEDHVSPQEARVLTLWAQGHTDASAARRMAVSLRTVRRLSDRLTERFGTRSRFQLGAVAITRRLIDPVEID